MCTNNTNREQALLSEEQKLNAELLELREWVDKRMHKQLSLHDQMVKNYDRILTKCYVYEEELERNRTENARFKFTSQCLMDKINELTSGGVVQFPIDSDNDDDDNYGNNDKCNTKDTNNDIDNDNDTDPIAKYMEVCSNTLIDEVGAYKEQVEKATIKLENIGDQLAKSAETEVCLKRCVENLTVLAENERIRRDKDEVELRTTVGRLEAELVEVRQEIDRLRSAEAELSVKLMLHEAEQDDSDEMLRAANARLLNQLGNGAIEEAALQSRVIELEVELERRTATGNTLLEQCQAGNGGGSIDSSSTSMILYQCNLSQENDVNVACFPDLGHGDDQLIPCLLSAKSCAAADDLQMSCSQSTDDDRRPSCPASIGQDSAETASERSLEELRQRRLCYIIKKYESTHDDDF